MAHLQRRLWDILQFACATEPFPLTLTLSLREREQPSPSRSFAHTGMAQSRPTILPLPRERDGVRGKRV